MERRLRLRWIVFGVALAVSLTLTIVFWPHAFFLAFVLPFLPFKRRQGPAGRRCPRCGWAPRDPGDRFCPRDGENLK